MNPPLTVEEERAPVAAGSELPEPKPSLAEILVGKSESKPEDLRPQEWATKAEKVSEIPPRRTGFNVILLISALLALLFIALYVSLGLRTSASKCDVQEYSKLELSSEASEAHRVAAKEALEKALVENATSRKELYDFTEKVGLALISLLSSVVGYTLKGEVSRASE